MTAQPTLFDGPDVNPADEKRLATALGRIYEALSGGRWYTLEALAKVGRCSEAAASARVRDLRKYRFGAHLIERRRVTETGLWAYRMVK